MAFSQKKSHYNICIVVSAVKHAYHFTNMKDCRLFRFVFWRKGTFTSSPLFQDVTDRTGIAWNKVCRSFELVCSVSDSGNT